MQSGTVAPKHRGHFTSRTHYCHMRATECFPADKTHVNFHVIYNGPTTKTSLRP